MRPLGARLVQRSVLGSKVLALATLLVAGIAGAGWLFDVPLLARGHVALPPMQPLTAVGIALGAMALLVDGETRGRRGPIAALLGATICLLGLLTMGRYVLGPAPSLHLAPEGVDSSRLLPYAGWPTPQTGINFVLLGIALLVRDERRGTVFVRQAAALSTAANAIAVLTAHILDTSGPLGASYRVPPLGMVPLTALSFLLLAIARLASRPEEGLMTLVVSDTRSGAMARRTLVAGLLGAPVIGSLTRLGVARGLYGVGVHISLFAVLTFGLILWTIWHSALQSEREELRAEAGLEAARCANEDLTQAIQRIRFAEAKSTGIVSISADAIISIDRDERITLFNEGAERIFGYARDEAVGAPLEMLIPERFRIAHRRHVADFSTSRDVARRMGQRDAEICGLRRNGEEFPADASISRLHVDGATILTVVVRDISEQKRIEREQRFLAKVGTTLASTLGYEQTVSNVAQLAVEEIADHCLVDVLEEDGEIRRLTVVSRDPTKARFCEALKQISIDRRRPHPLRSILESRQSELIESATDVDLTAWAQSDVHLRLLRALDPRSLIGVPLLAHGKILGVLVLASSAAGRRYGPSDVRLAEQLAQRAALAIDNARLYRVAQEAVRAREEMLAIVSHDLKNPLATASLVAELLRESQGMDARGLSDLGNMIRRSVDQMLPLVDGLVDLFRIERGVFAIVPSTHDLREVILPVIDSMRLQVERKHQTLEVSVPPKLRPVRCDAGRIGQVVSNLLGNAIKFTPNGGRIRVSAEELGDELVVSIADTGPGIPPEDRSSIFDRFWQGEGHRHLGSGLGLATAKGIVAAHGGQIQVDGIVGRGSIFSFTLPSSEETDDGTSRPPSPERTQS